MKTKWMCYGHVCVWDVKEVLLTMRGWGGAIDVKTGVTFVATDESQGKYEVHPDSKKPLIGVLIPDWKEVCEMAKALARRLPDAAFIGWDLAHTASGWVLVEGNIGPMIIYQIATGYSLRHEFERVKKKNQKCISLFKWWLGLLGALLVIGWLILLVWLFLHFANKGVGAFCLQERPDKGGKIYKVIKFKTMTNEQDKDGNLLPDEQRLTKVGKIVSSLSIDELPQLINILKGEMSVVGPRPEDQENAEKVYVGEFKRIMDVKPGLTSTASLYDYTHGELFEDEESYEQIFMPKKLKLYYVNHRSARYDLLLILKTAWLIILKTCGRKEFEEPMELGRC